MIDDDDMEISVQRHVAEWCLFNALAYLIPALFVDIILGAYGDKYGRQINILFGICGVALSEFGFLLILSETIHAPYYISPAFGLIAGMTGYITMLPVSSNAYLADITDNSDLLTIRAGVLSASQSLATVSKLN
jgi:MFS family permease